MEYFVSIALQVSPEITVYHVLHCEVVPLTVGDGGLGYAAGDELDVGLVVLDSAEVLGLELDMALVVALDPTGLVEPVDCTGEVVGACDGARVLVTTATFVPSTGPTLPICQQGTIKASFVAQAAKLTNSHNPPINWSKQNQSGGYNLR